MKNKKIIVLICIALIFISILMCFITKIDVTKYTISNEKIPEEFNGFKIVQLSDFHSQGYRNTTEDIINKVKANPSLSGGEKTDGYCPMNQCLPRILERI